MDRTIVDYAEARAMMVDGQVRPNKVTDPRIIAAMRRLPRERFLPPHLAALAYADEDVPLPGGRALIEPMVIARLAQLLAVGDGDRVLVVGCGAGYGAALLAACGGTVTALEEDPALAAMARSVLGEVAPDVAVVTGRLVDGWNAASPYHAILIEGAVDMVPSAIAQQLRPRVGRLATVRLAGGRVAHAVVGEAIMAPGTASGASEGGVALTLRPVFDCATPALPQFRREVGFAF